LQEARGTLVHSSHRLLLLTNFDRLHIAAGLPLLLLQVDYLLRYLRGSRVVRHPLFPEHEVVHELHPLPFAGLQVGGLSTMTP
jgi:hypothetical protein